MDLSTFMRVSVDLNEFLWCRAIPSIFHIHHSCRVGYVLRLLYNRFNHNIGISTLNSLPILAQKFLKIATGILDKETIKYKSDVVAQLIMKHFPDFRRVINELQKHAVGGMIDEDILTQASEENLKELFVALKKKDFTSMRKWVAENIDNDHVRLYRQIYASLYSKFEKKSIPQAVLTIADYSYKAAFVADQEVNMVACLTEMMMNCDFV